MTKPGDGERREIVGERVVLGPLTDADVVELHLWFLESEPESMTCRPVADRSILAAVQRFNERKDDPSLRAFAIRRREDGRLVGRVTLFDFNPCNRAAEVGYLIGPQFRRLGFARDALIMALRFAFDDLGFNKIMAQTGAFNAASVALLRGVGFTQDGRLRQHHLVAGVLHDDLIFSILADEFAAKHGTADGSPNGQPPAVE